MLELLELGLLIITEKSNTKNPLAHHASQKGNLFGIVVQKKSYFKSDYFSMFHEVCKKNKTY